MGICSCCDVVFEQKGKGLMRISLSSKFKGGTSIIDTLLKNFHANFNAGKGLHRMVDI
jgi:hypothetical protein